MNHRDAPLQFALLSFVRGITTLPQMCELLPGLFDCQDAPDGAALAVPPFRILLRRRGMRIVTLKPMVLDPFLHAMPVVSHAYRRR
jgi:hypothetical protein